MKARSAAKCWISIFLAQPCQTQVVAHAFDERGLEMLNVLLNERDVFVEELLLQILIGRTNDGDLA